MSEGGGNPRYWDNSVISEFTVRSSQRLRRGGFRKSEALVLEHAALLLYEHFLQGKETPTGVKYHKILGVPNVPVQCCSANPGELLPE